jgi:hypothetical protein
MTQRRPTPGGMEIHEFGEPGVSNLNDYDVEAALSGLDPLLKPQPPGPLPIGGASPQPVVIFEPYVGPDLASPQLLQAQNPGVIVIASEPLIPPSADRIAGFESGRGVFRSEALPRDLPPLSEVRIRFPLPNYKASELISADLARGISLQEASAATPTLSNAGPFALEHLLPGGTLEVVFYEQGIIRDVDALQQLTFRDPASGASYRFEIASATERVARGSVAPHSGFGVLGQGTPMTDAVEVFRVVLRKTATSR